MAAWRVPLADLTVSEDDIAAIAEVYRSGWLSMGPRTEDFERDPDRFAGVRHAIAVSSGTAALHLMYLAAGLGAGDEVIVPSLTFVATVNAITYTGATPVFADAAGLQSPWLSAKAVEAAITPRTRAIVAMPYGGDPGEIVALRELATRRGVPLLEDGPTRWARAWAAGISARSDLPGRSASSPTRTLRWERAEQSSQTTTSSRRRRGSCGRTASQPSPGTGTEATPPATTSWRSASTTASTSPGRRSPRGD
jgi:hypothetical protein